MTQTKKPDWGKRIGRASDLAERHAYAAEILRFYRGILEFQCTLYDGVALRPASRHEVPFAERLDVDAAARHLPALLTLVQKSGPSKLAQQAAEIGKTSADEQRQTLRDFLAGLDNGHQEPQAFFPRALFQPQAERLAATPAAELEGFAGSVCPVCGARPQVAVLHPEGDGGKRFLLCSFCLTEWEFRRILCPMCAEEDYQKLPRYSAEDPIAVRVEACDTCKYYLKSVDMTVDGLAVPVVDEIATAPLDLWAAEHGYSKISLNLMGF